jgi:hypothetical protein
MMYHKALLFGDADVAAQIEHEQDPERAKCVTTGCSSLGSLGVCLRD